MSNFINTYNGFLENWSDFFLTNSVEILFLAIPAAVFSLLFRKKSPRFHYILWTIVLLKSLIPSDIIRLPNPEVYTIQMPRIYTTIYTERIQPNVNMNQSILFVIWFAIASLLLIKLIGNSVNFYNILRSKRQIQSRIVDKLSVKYQINQQILVYEANIDVPFTIGFLSPKIFLPENSDLDKIDFIIAHEMAHIKRKDFLIILIQNFITIAFFFHPVVLIASGLLNYYREIICDDMAMEAINSTPQNYGRKIIDYLEFCIKQKKYPILANGLIFSKKIIIRRIEYLLNRKEGVISKLSKFQLLLICALICILFYIIACESVTKPQVYEASGVQTKTLTILSSDVTGDSVLVNVKFDNDFTNPEFTIVSGSKDNSTNESALTSVKSKEFVNSLKSENISEINVNVVFEKTGFNPKVKFIPYDQAPEPVGGFSAIQKNVIYPEIAQKSGVEGTVVIQCYIDENGIADDFNVLKGIPNTGLNEAAIEAVRKTKFKPAIRDDKNVGVWISIPIVFKLKNDQQLAKSNTGKMDKTIESDEIQKQKIVDEKSVSDRGQLEITSIKSDEENQVLQLSDIATGRKNQTSKLLTSLETTQIEKRPKFIPYDQAPEPIGGFAAIQKRVVYPEIAQEAGIEGDVVVQAFVSENGDIQSCNILKGIPNTGLNEAAINAVKETKFIPAKQKEKEVGVWISIPVVFRLT